MLLFHRGIIFCLLLSGIQTIFSQSDDDDGVSGPLQVGNHIPIEIYANSQPEIDYPNGRLQKTHKIYHEDATYISIHFSAFDLDAECTMKLTDGNERNNIVVRRRNNLGDFWAPHVNGDTMIIQVSCNDETNMANFAIDEYVAGFQDISRKRNLRSSSASSSSRDPITGRELSVCGTDEARNAQCYKDTYPTQYNTAKAVARLLIQGSGICTGWLVGPNNVLVTNQHCIKTEAQALSADYEFMYESENGDCNQAHKMDFVKGHQVFDGVQLLDTSYPDDYALIKLDGNPVGDYGYLELDNRMPDIGETIYIPQHMGGFDKSIGMFDSNTSDGKCQITSNTKSCGAFAIRGYYENGYTCDTRGGSSGAPVISESTNKVVALHHCGESSICGGNVGIPIAEIYDKISGYINGPQTPTVPTPTLPPIPVPPSPTRVPVPTTCTTGYGWTDKTGSTCTWYENNEPEGCPSWGWFPGNDGRTAGEACCHCAESCSNARNWIDDYGTTCDWYENNEPNGCSTWSWYPGSQGLTAGEACCHCKCKNMGGWKDDEGFQCKWYEENEPAGCPTWGYYPGSKAGGESYTAAEACCHCRPLSKITPK